MVNWADCRPSSAIASKIKRNSAKTSHLFANKSTKSKRQNRKASYLKKGDSKRYKDVL